MRKCSLTQLGRAPFIISMTSVWVSSALLFVFWLQHSICLSCNLGLCQWLQLSAKVHWVIASWLASVAAFQAGWPRGKCCWSSLSDDCSDHLWALKRTSRQQKLTQPLSSFALPNSKSRIHRSFLPASAFLSRPQLKAEGWEVGVRTLGK